VNFAAATTINASGAGKTTISAMTDVGAVTAFNSTGGGLSVPAIDINATFTGGAGADAVTLGATAKATNMGAGDDTVTMGASLATKGTIAGGEGTDTLMTTNAVAAANDAGATFNAAVTGFETLRLSDALSGTINVASLNNPSKVILDAGGNHATSAILNNIMDGATVEVKTTATGVTLGMAGAGANTQNVVNVILSNVTGGAEGFASFQADSIETINIDMNDTGTGANTAATIDTLTLAADAAKTIVVTGNNGLTLTNTDTTVTSFDSTAIAADATEDTAANLAVSWTTGALAGASTIKTGVGNDTIDASAAVKAVTIESGAGTDTLTGSATKANTIDGGAKNDAITGGAAADTITGGTGTDTFTFSSANIVEQAGSSTTDGTVINLGATALTSSAVFTMTAKYLSGAQTEVAAGTAVYTYSAESSTNASIIDTISGIENITGTNLIDYIVGTTGANVIQGGDGSDFITTGTGGDTVAITDTGSGNDFITDFTVGGGLEGDTVRLDLSGLEEDAAGNADVDLINVDLGTSSIAATDTVVLSTVTGAFNGDALTTDTTILIANLAANIANAGALETALETGGGLAFTTDKAIAAKDAILVAFDDGADSYLAHVEFGSAVNDNAIAAGASLAATIIATFDGVTDVTTLTADNFSLIA